MNVYADTSALVKLLVYEDGSDEALRLWNESTVTSSWLSEAEVYGALAKGERSLRISRRRVDVAIERWRRLSRAIVFVVVSSAVATHAGALAREHGLAGADAVHLATALSLRPSEVLFATWDDRLADAGRRTGLAVAP